MKLIRTALLLFIVTTAVTAFSQTAPTSPAESIRHQFAYINHKVLEMAKDFPEDKYGYRMKPEMRSFGEVIVHIAGGNAYAAKAGRGENVKWEDFDPKNYKTKAAVVALMEKSIADANATLKSLPDESFTKTIEPWIDVIEHSAEHYGLLVAYYRANGLVPPASRPKKK
jgi:hypothetical protein